MSRQTAPAAVRWTAYIGVAIVFAIACAFLSNWQLTKNAERSEQLALISRNYDAAPVPLAQLLPPGEKLAPSRQWRQAELVGRYLPEHQLLVRNRVHDGTAAYEIVVPFQLADGRVFLVDRGWEPPGNSQSLPDSLPAAPSGQLTVVVRLQPGEALPSAGDAAPAGQIPSIHLPTIAGLMGTDGDALDRGAYGTLVTESPAPATAPQPMEAPSDDPGPYLSYGVQWILFAVMGFVFIWYVIRSERRVRREEAAAAAAVAELAASDPEAAAQWDAEASARRARTRLFPRRSDRDADDEDALLDRAGR
ncbi:MAG: SURF1 family protein [Microbacterium sp.]|nr:SURF1 family protein [Microbacterium sp.]